MKKLKMILLGVLAISVIAVFTTPASAADWRGHERAEIRQEHQDAHRETFNHAYWRGRHRHWHRRHWRW